jgi:hypothetical protein
MSSQSIPRLFLICILLGIVIFSTIGMGSADVNILVSKGTHINVVDVEGLQVQEGSKSHGKFFWEIYKIIVNLNFTG